MGGGGGGETRSGTKKRGSHNLQSGHPTWWSADNCGIFPRSALFNICRKALGHLMKFTQRSIRYR